METDRQKYKTIYHCWKAIKQRTLNPKCPAYKNYGRRGITVCNEWMEFEPFLKWSLENGWENGLDIDRIDNNGNYEPSNCRWVTRSENVNNRRVTIMIEVDGENFSISDWSKKCGIPRGTLKVWSETNGKVFVSDQIKKALLNGYKCKDYGNTHRKPIVHFETGMVFESVRDAATYFGIAPCTISNAMRDKRKTGKGRFEWTDISDK